MLKRSVEGSQPGVVAKIGAALFGLWAILHIWVGYEGLHQYLVSPASGQWKMFIGGSNAPLSSFAFPTDAVTMHVHANLILNFCLDVAGYGVLGIIVAWLIYTRGSWNGYLLGVFLIGICDMSYLFLQITSGIIEPSIASVSGPIIWLIAVVITPFGMPSLSKVRRRATPVGS